MVFPRNFVLDSFEKGEVKRDDVRGELTSAEINFPINAMLKMGRRLPRNLF
jgi:hypothetical protein